MNGKVQWEFGDTDVLVQPSGTTTDNNNNIYVVGLESHNVVVTSPDGQSHKVLLSLRHGLCVPCGICCNTASNQLLLINGRDNAGLLYDISITST